MDSTQYLGFVMILALFVGLVVFSAWSVGGWKPALIAGAMTIFVLGWIDIAFRLLHGKAMPWA